MSRMLSPEQYRDLRRLRGHAPEDVAQVVEVPVALVLAFWARKDKKKVCEQRKQDLGLHKSLPLPRSELGLPMPAGHAVSWGILQSLAPSLRGRPFGL